MYRPAVVVRVIGVMRAATKTLTVSKQTGTFGEQTFSPLLRQPLDCGRSDSALCVLDGAAMRAGVQTGDRIIKVIFLVLVVQIVELS